MPSGSRSRRNSGVSAPSVTFMYDAPVGLVVERQVGHVGVEQLPGPAHDRGQDGVDVADRGEVAGGLVERGQLGLAGALARDQLAQPQGDVVVARAAARSSSSVAAAVAEASSSSKCERGASSYRRSRKERDTATSWPGTAGPRRGVLADDPVEGGDR